MESASYLQGSDTVTLRYTTIPALLDDTAARLGQKPAHIFRFFRNDQGKSYEDLDREVVTFGELADRSLRVAASLLDLGLKSGDNIGVIGGNCAEWLYLDYACLRIKVLLIRIPGNLMNHDALVEAVSTYKCRALFLDNEQDVEKILPGIISRQVNDEDAAKLKGLEFVGYLRAPTNSTPDITVASLLAGTGDTGKVLEIQETIDPDDVATTFPTSGTTGYPKFTIYTHFKLINGAGVLMNLFNPQADEDSKMASDRPFSWIGGLAYASVIGQQAFLNFDSRIGGLTDSTQVTFKLYEEEGVAATGCMAYVLFDARKAQEKGDLVIPESLQHIITGGERMSADLAAFTERTFKSVVVVYGATEMLFIVTNPPCPDETRDKSYLFPGTELKIVDSQGHVVPRGTSGDIHVRTPFSMNGYLYDTEKTSAVKPDSGWVDIGDIGVIHPSGLLEIIGRTKDVISRGGTKINPKAMEKLMDSCPNVQNAIAIGVPDPRLFEEICACVIPTEGMVTIEDVLRKFCDDNVLNNVGISPKYFVIMDEFPKGTTGKIDRKALVEIAIEKFNLK